MQKALDALKIAPKCGAYARSTNCPCKNASMENGRCRMHGGSSKGRPPTTGLRTKLAAQHMKEIKALLKALNGFSQPKGTADF